ncbi:hypothetical protein J6590_104202 [Homalodisca vitripennis]|nr:hypothetical protein J6590_104202 [Homalodisca vitripennis]
MDLDRRRPLPPNLSHPEYLEFINRRLRCDGIFGSPSEQDQHDVCRIPQGWNICAGCEVLEGMRATVQTRNRFTTKMTRGKQETGAGIIGSSSRRDAKRRLLKLFVVKDSFYRSPSTGVASFGSLDTPSLTQLRYHFST